MRFRSGDKCGSRFVGRPLLSLSSFLLAIAVGLISSFTFSAAYDMARASLYGGPQNISGVWHGHWPEGVHAMTVRLEQKGERLTGTARFSRVIVMSDGPKVVGVTPEMPLLNPELRGDRLTFEVQESDRYNTSNSLPMEMRFTNEGEAELVRERDGDDSVILTMLQESSF